MTEAERHTDVAPADESVRASAARAEPSADLATVTRLARGGTGVGLNPRTALALQRIAGNRVTAGLAADPASAIVRRVPRRLLRLGYPLGKPLPAGAPTPLTDETDHREWRKSDFNAFWEQEQGRKLSAAEKKNIDRGCIGITANVLEGSGNPSLDEVYDDFNTAHAAMVKHNSTWWNTYISDTRYVLFAILFWANQDPDLAIRKNRATSAFLADPVTRKIDMSGYRFRPQPGKVNFDFGFWDASVQSFWHANHSDSDLSDPMIVYQSTKDRFARRIDLGGGDIRYGYVDFDRVGYGVAVANNYDPSKARTP